MNHLSPFSTVLYEDKASWYTLAYPEDARLEALPVSTLSSLYPDVAELGPNAATVLRLFNDFAKIRDRFEVVGISESILLLSVLDDFHITTQAHYPLRSLMKNVTTLIEALNFDCSPSCGKYVCLTRDLTAEQSTQVQSLIWEALMVVVFEGFVDFELMEQDVEVAQIRDTSIDIFNRLLSPFYLNGSDYIQR